jgi:hypothetical protein
MRVRLACVVEGHGETSALPILLRRVISEISPGCHAEIPHPIRRPRSKLVQPGELERAVELAAAKVAPDGVVLVLLDADDDCPATVGPDLKMRAVRARADVPVSVVLARREFEAWYIAAARSLGLLRDPAEDPPADPEGVRGAKEWLASRMPRGKYSEAVDQPALAARFDLAEARRCPSFDKLYRDLEGLIAMWRGRAPAGLDAG